MAIDTVHPSALDQDKGMHLQAQDNPWQGASLRLKQWSEMFRQCY
jgi:hypothetical protein